jgi:hypothetical protein
VTAAARFAVRVQLSHQHASGVGSPRLECTFHPVPVVIPGASDASRFHPGPCGRDTEHSQALYPLALGTSVAEYLFCSQEEASPRPVECGLGGPGGGGLPWLSGCELE